MRDGVPVSFEEVKEAWRKADEGKPEDQRTPAVLECPALFVYQWWKLPLTYQTLFELRLIGGEPDTWPARLSFGTFRVRDCEVPERADPNREPSLLALIAIEDPATKRRVLIDGNKRAVVLWKRRQAGHAIPPDALLYVGKLHGCFTFAAAAVSSVWAPDRPATRHPFSRAWAAFSLALLRAAKRFWVVLRKGGESST